MMRYYIWHMNGKPQIVPGRRTGDGLVAEQPRTVITADLEQAGAADANSDHGAGWGRGIRMRTGTAATNSNHSQGQRCPSRTDLTAVRAAKQGPNPQR